MAKREPVAGTASDPVIEFAELEIDGEKYSLAYDFNAIAEAEKLAEANLLQGMYAVLAYTMTAGQLRGLFYAALRKAHPKMTWAEVGALLRIDTIPDIREAVVLAYNNAMPEKKRFLVETAKSAPPEISQTEKSGSNAGQLPDSPSA